MTPYEKQKICEGFRNQRAKIFIPLLEKFVKNNGKDFIDSAYPWSPFIPYAFQSYGINAPRIFYIGIDTYYWSTTPNDLLNANSIGNFEYFFRKNDDTVDTRRIMIEWFSNKGSFWNFVCKLHIFLRTGIKKSTEDLRNLTLNEIAIIDEIGYSNLNSIELVKTLKNEGNWEKIDPSPYFRIKEASDVLFYPVKNILDSYAPEYIIVLSANINEERFFMNLEYDKLSQYDEGSWKRMYRVKGYDTKIMMTCHPRGFSGQGTNDEEMVQYIADSLKLF